MLDGKDSNYFAIKTHNHDSKYLKLSGYEDAQTRYYTVSANSFNPNNNNCGFSIYSLTKYIRGTLGTCNYYVPINLPHGSKVKNIKLYFENSSGVNFNISLKRMKSDYSGINNMATITTSGSVAGVRSFDNSIISFNIIDNNQYAYWLQLENIDDSINHKVYRILLEYEVTNSLP